jgi:hypothetical protein
LIKQRSSLAFKKLKFIRNESVVIGQIRVE